MNLVFGHLLALTEGLLRDRLCGLQDTFSKTLPNVLRSHISLKHKHTVQVVLLNIH